MRNRFSFLRDTSRRVREKPATVGLILSAGLCATAFITAVPSFSASSEGAAASEPAVFGGAATIRRLNEAQYKRSIHDIFGADIAIAGRFEPPLRDEGLLAIGDSKVTISPSGLEQYELRARDIAGQLLSPSRRNATLGCAPKSADSFDESCAVAFLKTKGALLFRRPLSRQELATVVGLAKEVTRSSGDFYEGVQAGLTRLLISPYFLFRVEQTVPDARHKGVERLDDYSLATRLSFFLWDAPPDEELLQAAAKNGLSEPRELERQVDRMIASPRFAEGVRGYFEDMFGFDQFNGLTKDQTIYPKFSTQMAKDAKDQALLTIVDLLVANDGDYRSLFTTKKTFLNRNLGALYKIPVETRGFEGMVPYTFGQDDRRAGILTLAAFLMLDPTHEGRSSPTIRGKTVRELLLCQKVPPPPANVNFSIVQDVNDPDHKTARDRLTAHMENPACAGCHALTDPIGLGMENYDGMGAFRTHENGALIDASGKFEGKTYTGLMELTQLLHDSPSIPQCAVQRVYEYGVGRQATPDERKWLVYANQRFAADGYVFRRLMHNVAMSQPFRTVSAAPLAPSKTLAVK